MATERRIIIVDGDVARIPLTQGKTAIIDAADYGLVRGKSWHAEKRRHCWYAATKVSLGGSRSTTVYLHRLIMGFPENLVDHEDRDGLNNRRYNLRDATYTENIWNATMPVTNTSGYKGVCFCSFTGRWKVRIKVEGREVWIGRFDDIDEAAKAYLRASIEHHREFARVL